MIPQITHQSESCVPLDDLLVFHRLMCSLGTSFDLDTILRTILGHMERLIEAELCTLSMLDETRQELCYALAAGREEEALRGLRVKVGKSVAGWVVEHGESLIVPDAGDGPCFDRAFAARSRPVLPDFSLSVSDMPLKLRSFIALPLCGRKGTHGVLEILNPRMGQLTDSTIAFLHMLADHAAIAIENACDVARLSPGDDHRRPDGPLQCPPSL